MSLHFTQRTLEEMLEMVQTPSWALLMNVMGETYYNTTIDQIDTIEELYQHKGEQDVLKFLETLPDYLREAMEQDAI